MRGLELVACLFRVCGTRMFLLMMCVTEKYMRKFRFILYKFVVEIWNKKPVLRPR